MRKTTIQSVIFNFDRELEQYVPVTGVIQLSQVYKMTHGEMPWGGDPFYYVVVGEEEGSYYPLPLLYVDAKNRQAAGIADNKSVPSEDWAKTKRRQISNVLLSYGMTFHKRKTWDVPMSYRRQIGDAFSLIASGKGYEYAQFDECINTILRKKGTEFMMDLIEKDGFGLFFGSPEFGLYFDEKDLGCWFEYDLSSWDTVVFKFAAHCCVRRAEESKEDVGVSDFGAVEDFIDELREWLAVVESECDV